ncbi:TPA_asm: DUF551 domain-containing protein [Salmonella enterica subsp. enterica]|nr:DUF551 domain-containing protein [Salmonella enterica subsp. enterica]
MSTITQEQVIQIEAAAKEVLWPIVWTEKKARAHFSKKVTPEIVLELARIARAYMDIKPPMSLEGEQKTPVAYLAGEGRPNDAIPSNALPQSMQVDIEMLASALRNVPLAPSDSQGITRTRVVKHQITGSMAKDIALKLGAELNDEEADIFADGYNAAMLKVNKNASTELPNDANLSTSSQAEPDDSGLLPCPFCGSPAEHYPDGDMEGYIIMCGNKNGDCNLQTFGFTTPEEAEKAWNTRAAIPQTGNFRENPISSTNNFRKIADTSTNSPVTPDGWISCSERMPNDKDYVWCWGKSYGWTECDTFEGYYDWSRNKWWAVTDDVEEPASKVTHWMPLPEPPQEVK